MKLEICININLNNFIKRNHLEKLEKIDFGKLDSQVAIIKENGEDYNINLRRGEYNSGDKFDLTVIYIKYTRLDNKIINNLIKIQELINKINNYDLRDLPINVEHIIDDLKIVDYSTEKNCQECYQYTMTLEKLFSLYCNYLKKYLNNEIDKNEIWTQNEKEVLDKVIENKEDDKIIIEYKNNYISRKEKLDKYINYKNELEEIRKLED